MCDDLSHERFFRVNHMFSKLNMKMLEKKQG